jgi:predicted Zn finger-like uncharacterized protein
MNVTCPNCATVYRVDPAKVPAAGVRARCAVCSAVFAVNRENRAEMPGAVAASAPAPATAAPVAAPPVPPAPSAAAPVTAPVVAPLPPPAARPMAPAAMPPRPVMPPAPPAPPAPAGAPRPAAPVRPQQPAAPTAPTVPPPPRPAAAAPSPGARPTNPFLSQDPSLKARRLARALVSDIVVYHPAKRQEGIRDGNLKELFEEEIKKSWEEYTEQVGREVAESTGFFREALNEILAGGRQVF